MREFEQHLDFYENYWWAGFSKIVPEPQWGNKKIAEDYFDKYWLPQMEYETIWKPIQDKIFVNQEKSLPEPVFSEHFSLLALRGGCLFLEEDFKQLQQCLLAIGEKNFVVIENTFNGKLQEPAFRMKFPSDITWDEMISGNYISAILLEMYHNEYYVFGESRNWGKYSASDYTWPLDLIGFKPEYSTLFEEKFKQAEEEKQKIKEWLPLAYQKRIKN